MTDIPVDEEGLDKDPAVPTELLELHMLLEAEGITPAEFKEVCDNETGTES